MVSNRYGLLADAEPNPQPFAATQNTAFQTAEGAGQQADGLDAEAARIKHIRSEGAKLNIQEWFLESAISAGVTWHTLMEQLAIGHHAAALAAAGTVPTPEDLAKLTPVSKQAADLALRDMQQLQQQQQQLAATQPPATPPPLTDENPNAAKADADAEKCS